MITTLSSKGQVVLPRLLRTKLQLVPGSKLHCRIQGDSIILKAQAPKRTIPEFVTDEVTGLRVKKRTASDAVVTSEMVKALLADFP